MHGKRIWLLGAMIGLLFLFAFVACSDGYTRQTKSLNLDAPDELVIDVTSRPHFFSEWTGKSMAMFSDALSHAGVRDLFSLGSFYLTEFSLFAGKTTDGYSVDQMKLSMAFSGQAKIYNLDLTLNNTKLTCDIKSNPSYGLAVTGTLLYEFMAKMDKLDIRYFIEQLAEHDHITIGYLFESMTVNPDNVKTFFVFPDGEIRLITDKSKADISDGVQVLEIVASKDGVDGEPVPVDKVRIYFAKE